MIFVDDELALFVDNIKFLNGVPLNLWIPAFAGMTLPFLSFTGKYFVIPAKAGIQF